MEMGDRRMETGDSRKGRKVDKRMQRKKRSLRKLYRKVKW